MTELVSLTGSGQGLLSGFPIFLLRRVPVCGLPERDLGDPEGHLVCVAVSDGLLVRIQFLVQVQLTAIGTFRIHGLAVHPFEIIPPLFDGIDASVANLVVELGDPLAGEG